MVWKYSLLWSSFLIHLRVWSPYFHGFIPLCLSQSVTAANSKITWDLKQTWQLISDSEKSEKNQRFSLVRTTYCFVVQIYGIAFYALFLFPTFHWRPGNGTSDQVIKSSQWFKCFQDIESCWNIKLLQIFKYSIHYGSSNNYISRPFLHDGFYCFYMDNKDIFD